MKRLFKALFFLMILATVAVFGYAFLGDLSAPQTEIMQKVTLNAQ